MKNSEKKNVKCSRSYLSFFGAFLVLAAVLSWGPSGLASGVNMIVSPAIAGVQQILGGAENEPEAQNEPAEVVYSTNLPDLNGAGYERLWIQPFPLAWR